MPSFFLFFSLQMSSTWYFYSRHICKTKWNLVFFLSLRIIMSHFMTHVASISVASITMYTNQLVCFSFSECVLPEIEWNAHCSFHHCHKDYIYLYIFIYIYIYMNVDAFFYLFKRDRNECTFLGSALFIFCLFYHWLYDRSTLSNFERVFFCSLLFGVTLMLNWNYSSYTIRLIWRIQIVHSLLESWSVRCLFARGPIHFFFGQFYEKS